MIFYSSRSMEGLPSLGNPHVTSLVGLLGFAISWQSTFYFLQLPVDGGLAVPWQSTLYINCRSIEG
jgi:hypothetical protein